MGKNTGRYLQRSAAIAILAVLGACATEPPAGGVAEQPGAPAAGSDNGETAVDAGYAPPVDPLLAPVRAALARGDWVAATLALPRQDQGGAVDPATGAWLAYYRARIALLRGSPQEAAQQLEVAAAANSPALQRELLLQRLRMADLRGDARATANAALALLRAGGHVELPPADCERLLWSAVQSLDARRGSDEDWRAWSTLARAANLDDGAAAAAALEDWLRSHPGHPAEPRARLLQRAAVADAGILQPALVLPLSGPLAEAGAAVARGAFAAYYAAYATPGGPEQIAVLDSRRYPRIEDAYLAALGDGADALLGPLGKLQVSELLRAGFADVPLLTLNRPDPLVPAPTGALQLSLAPEDEALQIARRAFAAGARAAVILRPEGVWGDRMESALLEAWRPLGGRTLARALYARASTYSAVLQQALNLDASTVRQRELRKLFSDPVESVEHRRRDVDVIFLLTRNADEARALKPLINYHYAGDLPVYALSTADDGGDGAGNRDLAGIRLPVMPWRLGDTPPGFDAAATDSGFASLHALGVDAWRLARRANRLASGAGLRFAGYTARLSVGANNALERELPMAEFSGGILRPL